MSVGTDLEISTKTLVQDLGWGWGWEWGEKISKSIKRGKD